MAERSAPSVNRPAPRPSRCRPTARSSPAPATARSIRLLDVASGKVVRLIKGHGQATVFVAFAPDGKTLASAGAVDHTIRLHKVADGSLLRQIVLQANEPAPGGVVFRVGGASPRLHLAFSADGRTLLGQFIGGAGQVFNINGGMQGAGPAGTALRLWDVATGTEMRKFALPRRYGTGSVAVSPDGRVAATENADGTLSLWETASGKQRLLLGEPKAVAQVPPAMGGAFFVVSGPQPVVSATNTLTFSPDGRLLAGRGPDRSIRIWDAAAGKAIGQLDGHEGAVTAIAFQRRRQATRYRQQRHDDPPLGHRPPEARADAVHGARRQGNRPVLGRPGERRRGQSVPEPPPAGRES